MTFRKKSNLIKELDLVFDRTCENMEDLFDLGQYVGLLRACEIIGYTMYRSEDGKYLLILSK